jgi:ABC-type transport system involved in multi-copper enzyme maturation permease subunit
MQTTRESLRANLRIILVIAAKDITDAIKNKTTLSIMLGVGVMMLVGLALPLLLGLRHTPTAIVYDPDRSTLIRGLTARSEFRLRLVDSQEELEPTVAGSPELVLGIVIPAGFQQAEGSGGEIAMDGYFAHWAKPDEVAELVAFFEEELGAASWQTVHIAVEGHAVYPSSELGLQPLLLAMNLTILLLVVGLALVPHLLIEEKETHTFEALLVSPARFSQVVAGKALAGVFYCLCAAVVVFVFNTRWIVHWEIAALAFLLGAAFAVAVGLLMGIVSENPATINLWMSLVLMILLVPALLAELASARLPAVVQEIVPWMPSVAMAKLLGFSMVGAVPAGDIWSNAGILAAESLVFYALVVWRVRRMDR